jgi:hypothetical protein
MVLTTLKRLAERDVREASGCAPLALLLAHVAMRRVVLGPWSIEPIPELV